MRDSYFLREQTPGISRNFSENLNNSSQNNKTRYGRVLRIVLEDGVGAYTKDGEKLPIGAIEYQDLSTTPSENIITGYAIPLASATKKTRIKKATKIRMRLSLSVLLSPFSRTISLSSFLFSIQISFCTTTYASTKKHLFLFDTNHTAMLRC